MRPSFLSTEGMSRALSLVDDGNSVFGVSMPSFVGRDLSWHRPTRKPSSDGMLVLCAGTARSLFQPTGPPRRTDSKRAVSHGSGLFAARSALISAVKLPITRASNETTAISLSDFTRKRWINAHVGALRGVEWLTCPIAKMLCAEVVHCLRFE